MKLFLATLSGFVITLSIFAAGAISAIYITNEAEPVPIWKANEGSPWTIEPVAASAEPIERLTAKAPSAPRAAVKGTNRPPVDMTTTGAIQNPTPEPSPEPAAEEPAAMVHVQWCSERYRSYRQEDNSYRSYSGRRRPCVSPFSDASGRSGEPFYSTETTPDQPPVGYPVEEVEEPANYLTQRHIAACFSRYRSYSPEDNSYQPYGGGSRRKCE